MPAHVLDYLMSWLRYRKTPEAAIALYANRCRRQRPQDGMPCPKCFVDPASQHNEQALTSGPAEHGIERLFCKHCKTTYEVPEAVR